MTCGLVTLFISQIANATQESVVFHTKDPVIRQLMLEALQGKLDINIGDKSRSGSITDWSIEAARQMRLVMPEDEVQARVAARLDAFLDGGRSLGLSKNPDPMQILNAEIGPIVPSGTSFADKYKPTFYADLRKKLAQEKLDDASYYSVGLYTAYLLAREVEDQPHTTEIVTHMIRLNDFYRAIETADPIKDAAALINLGMMSAFDFLGNTWPRSSLGHAQLEQSIWAFARVRGPLKIKVEQMLLDFAREIMKDADPKAGHGFPNLEGHAIRALRLTGRLQDADVIQEIQRLSDQALEHPYNFRYHVQDVREALTAIGDTERLGRYAEKLRPESPRDVRKPKDLLALQLRDEQHWREAHAKSRQEVTAEARRRLIEEGYTLLRTGKSARAFEPLVKARNRLGLLEFVRRQIHSGDALNALFPLTAAATLLPEDDKENP